jgi:glutamine phosphoribosylpyrophosphate amidotransferase
MCGIVGVSLTNVTEEDISLVKRIFRETQIRGMHASGVAYHNGSALVREIAPVPISELTDNLDWSDISSSGDLKMIAHARYSTSDMEFHQPLGDSNLYMAHNGVITQESPETWEKTYGYNFCTRNDSEILLKFITSGYTSSGVNTRLNGASISVVTIDSDGVVSGWRNSLRPLWRTDLPSGYILTSTRDIVSRASGNTLTPVKLDSFEGSHDYQIRQ